MVGVLLPEYCTAMARLVVVDMNARSTPPIQPSSSGSWNAFGSNMPTQRVHTRQIRTSLFSCFLSSTFAYSLKIHICICTSILMWSLWKVALLSWAEFTGSWIAKCSKQNQFTSQPTIDTAAFRNRLNTSQFADSAHNCVQRRHIFVALFKHQKYISSNVRMYICTYSCVCERACVSVCIFIFVCVCRSIHMHVHIHTQCVCVYVCVCKYFIQIYIYIYIDVDIYMYIYIYVYMCTNTHTYSIYISLCVHTNIHMYWKTQKHTLIQIQNSLTRTQLQAEIWHCSYAHIDICTNTHTYNVYISLCIHTNIHI